MFFSSKWHALRITLISQLTSITKRHASDTLFCQPAYSSPSYQHWSWDGSRQKVPQWSHTAQDWQQHKASVCFNFSREYSPLPPETWSRSGILLLKQIVTMSPKPKIYFHPFGPYSESLGHKKKQSKPSPWVPRLLPSHSIVPGRPGENIIFSHMAWLLQYTCCSSATLPASHLLGGLYVVWPPFLLIFLRSHFPWLSETADSY